MDAIGIHNMSAPRAKLIRNVPEASVGDKLHPGRRLYDLAIGTARAKRGMRFRRFCEVEGFVETRVRYALTMGDTTDPEMRAFIEKVLRAAGVEGELE